MSAGGQIYPMIVNWEMIYNLSTEALPPFDPSNEDNPDVAEPYHLAPEHLRKHFLYWDGYGGEGFIEGCDYHYKDWYENFGRILLYLQKLLDDRQNYLLDKIFNAISPTMDASEDDDVDRFENGVLPPWEVRDISRYFEELDTEQILSLIKNCPFDETSGNGIIDNTTINNFESFRTYLFFYREFFTEASKVEGAVYIARYYN